MNEMPRECRESELSTLPRPRCEKCGARLRPDHRPAEDLEGAVDPVYVVGFKCRTRDCPG